MTGTGERTVGIYKLQVAILSFYLILGAAAAWNKLRVCTKCRKSVIKPCLNCDVLIVILNDHIQV